MDEQNTGKKNSGMIFGTVLALVVAVAGYGFYKYTKKEDATIEPVVTPNTENTNTEPTISYIYKDGTYTSTGNYVSPGGAEEVGVSLTIKNDAVTSVTVTPKATRPISLQMQNTVATNISPLVVGKKLDEVLVDKVSGSSLTPKGFMDAVAKIKAQAKA